MRYAAIFEYDGSDFNGWQRQPHASSIQEEVERAISTVANHEVSTQCAGRTDTGVHALGQVVHFDTIAERNDRSWLLGVNSNLPSSITMKKIIAVKENFHARFSARERTYRYVIFCDNTRSALLSQRAVWEHRLLHMEPMREAASYLIGEHDFSSYRALACQAKNPVREITRFTINQSGSLIIIELSANGFLHHMVRNIVGVLLTIGKLEQKPEWAHQVLLQKNRSCAAMTAPAHGLYLLSVRYDSEFNI